MHKLAFYSSVQCCSVKTSSEDVKHALIKLNRTLSACMWMSLTPFLAVCARACMLLCVLDGLSRKGNTTQ